MAVNGYVNVGRSAANQVPNRLTIKGNKYAELIQDALVGLGAGGASLLYNGLTSNEENEKPGGRVALEALGAAAAGAGLSRGAQMARNALRERSRNIINKLPAVDLAKIPSAYHVAQESIGTPSYISPIASRYAQDQYGIGLNRPTAGQADLNLQRSASPVTYSQVQANVSPLRYYQTASNDVALGAVGNPGVGFSGQIDLGKTNLGTTKAQADQRIPASAIQYQDNYVLTRDHPARHTTFASADVPLPLNLFTKRDAFSQPVKTGLDNPVYVDLGRMPTDQDLGMRRDMLNSLVYQGTANPQSLVRSLNGSGVSLERNLVENLYSPNQTVAPADMANRIRDMKQTAVIDTILKYGSIPAVGLASVATGGLIGGGLANALSIPQTRSVDPEQLMGTSNSDNNLMAYYAGINDYYPQSPYGPMGY